MSGLVTERVLPANWWLHKVFWVWQFLSSQILAMLSVCLIAGVERVGTVTFLLHRLRNCAGLALTECDAELWLVLFVG